MVVQNFLAANAKEIFSVLLPLLGWSLSRMFRDRARLQYSRLHQFMYSLTDTVTGADGIAVSKSMFPHTQSLIVQNTGRETATKVEIINSWRPQYFNLWPPLKHNEETRDTRHYVTIDSLAPGQRVQMECLVVNVPMPTLMLVHCDQCEATEVLVAPLRVFGPWVNRLFGVLLLAGASLLLYLLLVLLQFLLATPTT